MSDLPRTDGFKYTSPTYGDMSLNEQQLFAISITERVCSVVSLISAGIAILTYLSRSAFRKPINRLIFYALWGNIIFNIATLISRSGLQHGIESALCQFQAFLVQWFVSETNTTYRLAK
jgi:hypothetical protein